MLTKAEFANGCRVYQRQIIGAVTVLTVAWGLITTVFAVQFERWFRAHTDALFGFFLFVSLVVYMAGVIFAARKIARRRGVMCPSCGNFMGELQLMLKTNKCRRCHSAIYVEG